MPPTNTARTLDHADAQIGDAITTIREGADALAAALRTYRAHGQPAPELHDLSQAIAAVLAGFDAATG